MTTKIEFKNGITEMAIPFKSYKDMEKWIIKFNNDIKKIERYSNTRINIYMKSGNILKVSK